MGSASHKYSDKGYFHNLGIDNIDGSAVRGQWVVKRLQSIIKMLGHEKVGKDIVSYQAHPMYACCT